MMSEKRFVYGVIKGSRQAHIIDCHTCKSATIDVYDDDILYFVDLLNELSEENEQLRQKANSLQTSLNYWQKSYNELLEKIPPKVKEVWLE